MCWGSERAKSGWETVRVGDEDWRNGRGGRAWGFLRWVVWSEGRRSGSQAVMKWCESARSWEWWAELEWIGQVQRWRSQRGWKGGEVGPWNLPDYKADRSFWHLEEWCKDEEKNRWALTPLWPFRCLRWSIIGSECQVRASSIGWSMADSLSDILQQ